MEMDVQISISSQAQERTSNKLTTKHPKYYLRLVAGPRIGTTPSLSPFGTSADSSVSISALRNQSGRTRDQHISGSGAPGVDFLQISSATGPTPKPLFQRQTADPSRCRTYTTLLLLAPGTKASRV